MLLFNNIFVDKLFIHKCHQQLSCETITVRIAVIKLLSMRQKKAPPLFHCDDILFISPKQAKVLPPITHLEWSSCSFQVIPFRFKLTALKTW